MPTVKVLKRAEIELTESCEWYEKHRKGLSKSFRKELGNVINTISSNPYLYNNRYDINLCFAGINKFPFVVVYWFDERVDTVFIASVFHTKRNPEY